MDLRNFSPRKSGLVAAGALAATLAAGQAGAVAAYHADASATLTLLTAVPLDEGAATPLDLDISFANTDGVFEEANNGFALGESSATNAIIGSFFEPSFEFNVAASARGEAAATDTAFGDSFTDAFASFGIDIINTGDTGYEVFVEIDFALDASASVDDTTLEGAESYAEVVVGGFNEGDLLLGTNADTSLIAAAGYGGAESEVLADSAVLSLSFLLDAGEAETLFVETYALGFADASPVPVPPALPLLASALLGSAVFARRPRA